MIKRWLQRQRLESAISLNRQLAAPVDSICDFGAGDGELCKALARQNPAADIHCYEPTPHIRFEACDNLQALNNIEIHALVESMKASTMDRVFCLEVFEHLPAREYAQALSDIFDLLKPGGYAILGVPVETGIPALYKGLFRMTRRYGAFDANIKNIALALIGRPPTQRPVSETEAGISYLYDHMGFKHRDMKRQLCKHFNVIRQSASPFPWFGSWLMPEVYFVIQKVADKSSKA